MDIWNIISNNEQRRKQIVKENYQVQNSVFRRPIGRQNSSLTKNHWR